MKRLLPSPLLAALGLTLASSSLAAPLDFTPTETRTVEDGMPLRRVSFRDGEKAIFFQAPKTWQMFGSGDQIAFTAPAPLEGEVRLGNSTIDPSIPFDEPGRVLYRAAARKLLPVQAQNVEVVSETADAFTLDDWKSFEIRLAYTLSGKKKLRTVLFVTMNPQRQVRLLADGDETRFEEVYAAGRTLIGSWFEPPAGWPGFADR